MVQEDVDTLEALKTVLDRSSDLERVLHFGISNKREVRNERRIDVDI